MTTNEPEDRWVECTWDETGECAICAGEVCYKCGAGMWRNPWADGILCEHDSLERHEMAP